jgi:predicted enzyme related to lactoylglutathione lyase
MEGESMNPVVHFEMSFDNRERMAKFYRSAFGWQTQMLGEEMGNYVLPTTTEPDETGPKNPRARLRSSASPVSLRLSCPLTTAADA